MKLCLKKQLVDDYQSFLPKSKVQRPGTDHVSHKGEGSCQEGERDVSTNLSNKNCTTNFWQDAKRARWNYNIPQQHGQTGLFVTLRWVHLSFCGPALFIVKLWRQSRRAQKPDIVDIVVPNRLLGRSVLDFLLSFLGRRLLSWAYRRLAIWSRCARSLHDVDEHLAGRDPKNTRSFSHP